MPDLVWRSVTELSRMILAKAVSPVEVVRAFLDRVTALDGKLKAFITVCADSALEAARAAEAELVAGRAVGPLHGVPYGPKDLYNTRGVRTTGGSKILADFVPADDATVVRRLRAAGAIVLGKLNMHEFAYGPEGLNAHYGDAVNPWDAGTRRIAGGSSSGSGVAVAAALAPAALTGDVKGLRVGLLRSHFTDVATPEVRDAVLAAARTLERAGAVVDEVNLAEVARVSAASLAIVPAEALAYHADWLRTRAADYQPDVRERLMIGAFVTGVQYVRGQQARQLLRQEVDAALERRDVLLAPATPIPAPVLGEKKTMLGDGESDVRSALIRLTRPFNLSGHPACSVACGFTTRGLPIGMQIVGRPFDEATVLRAADAYQRSTDWHTRHPVLA